MNILHIIGFLGADPEERFTPSGQKLWVLRVATKSKKNGQEETIWWRITVWGDQFDKILAYFKKGKPIYIIAEMNKLDVYMDKNGQPQVSYDATARSIHFLPMSNDRQEQEGQQQSNQGGGYPSSNQQQQPHQGNARPSAYGGGSQANVQKQPQMTDFAPSMAPFSGMGAGSDMAYPDQDEPIPF